jgi:hypothetical protein
MEVILDELKQYDLRRFNKIENICFENDCNESVLNKYYLCVQFHNNIIISICTFNKACKNDVQAILLNKGKHLYEFEYNFEMQNIYDIFYNFCLNNFINSAVQITQMYMYIGLATCEIRLIADMMYYATVIKTIFNFNKLNLFYDAINDHDYCTIIRVFFKQN